ELVELRHVDATVLLAVLDEELDRIGGHTGSFPADPASVTSVRSSRELLPDPRLHPRSAAPGLRRPRLPGALPEGEVPPAGDRDPDEGALPAALVPEGQ